MIEFDFDKLSALCLNNPQEYFAARRKMIDELIQSAPEERRSELEALQDKIDEIRMGQLNPMAATASILILAANKATELRDHMQELGKALRKLENRADD